MITSSKNRIGTPLTKNTTNTVNNYKTSREITPET